MKALVLAAGRGKRIGELTESINKCLIEVYGKPLIEYSFDCVCGLETIEEIVVVVGYKAQDIINRYGSQYKEKKITYVHQGSQKGLVHAIEAAKEAIAGQDFMLMLADEFMVRPHHKEFIEEFKKSEAFVLCGMLKVQDRSLISKTYTVFIDNLGVANKLIEKPAESANDLMGTGNCLFKNAIFDYIASTPVNSNRQEKELPDLIQSAINDRRLVKTFMICQQYINVNSQEELNKTFSYFTHL